jgi:hypothetical protein
MAKKKEDEAQRVRVLAVAGFRYDGEYRRTGEALDMRKADVADYVALNMVREYEGAVDAPKVNA